MEWFVLALISAFSAATYGVLIKRLVKEVDEYLLAAVTMLIGALFVLIISLANGLPQLNSTFFYAVLLASIINTIALIFFYKALKIADISLVTPFISFTPLFLIFTSYLILGEQASLQGKIGIGFIVLGAYLINFKKSKNILKPFKELFRNKGILFMLCTALLWSLTANFYKLAVINSNAFFAIFSIYFLMSVLLFSASCFRKKSLKINKLISRKYIKQFFFIGIIIALGDIALALAFTQQIVPYVISIKRTSILFSVIYGMVVFKEKGIPQRLLSALIMLVGILLIVLF